MTPEEKAVIDAAMEWFRDPEVRNRMDHPAKERYLIGAIQTLDFFRRAKSAIQTLDSGLCNAASPGGSMRCILPESHRSDRRFVLHEGRTRNGHRRLWKEYR